MLLEHAPHAFWVILSLSVGLILASFFGLVVARLPLDPEMPSQPVIWTRSACPNCRTRLGPFDLVPLFSRLWLKGKCRTCGVRISLHYAVIEWGSLVMIVWAAVFLPAGEVLASAVLAPALLALAWTDWKYFWLPDRITLPMIAVGLVVSAWKEANIPVDAVVGSAVGFLSLTGINMAYRAWRGRDGLGGGDAKLMAAAGAWLGWPSLPTLLLVASVTALGVVLVWRLRGATITAETAFPFGVPLAAGFWLVWVHGAVGVA